MLLTQRNKTLFLSAGLRCGCCIKSDSNVSCTIKVYSGVSSHVSALLIVSRKKIKFPLRRLLFSKNFMHQHVHVKPHFNKISLKRKNCHPFNLSLFFYDDYIINKYQLNDFLIKFRRNCIYKIYFLFVKSFHSRMKKFLIKYSIKFFNFCWMLITFNFHSMLQWKLIQLDTNEKSV